jgi:hypothetical protein
MNQTLDRDEEVFADALRQPATEEAIHWVRGKPEA